MTWRRLILNELIKMKFNGNLLYFINNFLSERKFRVNIGNTFSSERTLENGIPQGSVLSVILFNIAINSLTKIMKGSVKFAMYADDLVII
jgi:retron-type reverse transcriptase